LTITESDVLYINGVKSQTNQAQYLKTGWEFSNNKSLNSLPNAVSGLEAQAGKIIYIHGLEWCLDYGTVAFDFAGTLKFRYATSNRAALTLNLSVINSATDYFYASQGENARTAINEGIELYCDNDATVGDGVYYYRLTYSIEDAPF